VYVSWSSSSTYGGDSGNRIFVLYWSCSLIRVSVIRGSTVYEETDLQWRDQVSAAVELNSSVFGVITRRKVV
jgi:hypothetical protein